MTQPRQRHIPLSFDDRRVLDRRKRDYEDRTGDTGDWGKFLGIISLAGLATLGIYSVAQATKRAPTVWQVNCSHCGMGFAIQVPNPPPWRLAQVRCANCSRELVIDFAQSASGVSNEHGLGPDSGYTAYCSVCQQPIKAAFSRVNPRGIEYLECAHCGRVPSISSGG